MTVKIISRRGCLEKSGNKDYILGFIDKVIDRIDLAKIGIRFIVFKNCRGYRGYYSDGDCVNLDPATKSFSASYRGYKYKTFGGVADLTPGGVLAHELGHAFHTAYRRTLTPAFRAIRKKKRRSITSYGTKSVGEDIAESFRLYVTNPDALKRVAPERFDAINRFGQYILNN